MLTLAGFLENQHQIRPHIRRKALWEHTDGLRRLWDERYYATEAGEALLLGAYFRIQTAIRLREKGLRIKGDRA